jgi:hypothetical protein
LIPGHLPFTTNSTISCRRYHKQYKNITSSSGFPTGKVKKKGKQNHFIHAAACRQAIRGQYKKRKKNHFKPRISDRQLAKERANKTTLCRGLPGGNQKSIQETKEKSQKNHFKPRISDRQSVKERANKTTSCCARKN